MSNKILFFDVVLKKRIWGGDYLKKLYNMNELLGGIGEAWLVSGHQDGQSTILNGEFEGQKLNDIYLQNRKLFGDSKHDRFPLLIKYIDANDDLSIQVHPDDSIALKVHQELGKTECWYVLDAKNDASIVYGHNAKNIGEFKEMFEQKQYGKLFSTRKIKKGDFVFIPAGVVHAIGAGVKILEIQQSSDVTYRLYDYDRTGGDGIKRELHVKEALQCIKFGENCDATKDRLISCDKFSVDKFDITSSLKFVNHDYAIIYVVNGKGQIDFGEVNYKIYDNDIFIVTSNASSYVIEGNLQILHIKEGMVSIDNILKGEE